MPPCHLTRRGRWKIPDEQLKKAREAFGATGKHEGIGEELVLELIDAISGMSADPVLTDSFLFFHSYRKVQEGISSLG